MFLLPVHYIHGYQNLVEAIVDIRAENMIVTSASDVDVCPHLDKTMMAMVFPTRPAPPTISISTDIEPENCAQHKYFSYNFKG